MKVFGFLSHTYALKVRRRKTSTSLLYFTQLEEDHIVQPKHMFLVNSMPLESYFRRDHLVNHANEPLRRAGLENIKVKCHVRGGGVSGQAGAIRHALARTIVQYDESFRPLMRKHGLLTRDSRMVERKKPGRKKARKSFQWVKR